MNAELDILPPLRPLDDERVARADAASTTFLERLESERRAEARRQSMRVIRVPGYVFEETAEFLV